MTIEEISEANNAAILTDRDGDVALLARIYNNEGIKQVRYSPDPCHYYSPEKWEQATPEIAASMVC